MFRHSSSLGGGTNHTHGPRESFWLLRCCRLAGSVASSSLGPAREDRRRPVLADAWMAGFTHPLRARAPPSQPAWLGSMINPTAQAWDHLSQFTKGIVTLTWTLTQTCLARWPPNVWGSNCQVQGIAVGTCTQMRPTLSK